jgi:hypothetical protein
LTRRENRQAAFNEAEYAYNEAFSLINQTVRITVAAELGNNYELTRAKPGAAVNEIMKELDPSLKHLRQTLKAYVRARLDYELVEEEVREFRESDRAHS